MSNKNRNVLYIGVTSNLEARILEHKSGTGSWFTRKYNCHDIVFYQFFESIEKAIRAEKRLKKYPRSWKENLIISFNRSKRDLSQEIEGMN